MFEVRLWLSKQGRIKYVSHLDMFRLMQRAVRRAEIPLWYTEGFNPHPYISFLLALSLGTGRQGRFFRPPRVFQSFLYGISARRNSVRLIPRLLRRRDGE